MNSDPTPHERHCADRHVRAGWTSEGSWPRPSGAGAPPPSHQVDAASVPHPITMKRAVSLRWILAIAAVAAEPITDAHFDAAIASLTGRRPDHHVLEQALTVAGRGGWITKHRDETGAARYSCTPAGRRLLPQLPANGCPMPSSDNAPTRDQAARAELPLTARQQRVAVLVATGRTSREIAAHLGCAPRTVDNHVAQILTRLDLSSRHELARTVAADPHLRQLVRLEPASSASRTGRSHAST